MKKGITEPSVFKAEGSFLTIPFLQGWVLEGADVKRLQERVLEIGNMDDFYWFARDVNGADIKRLQERILKIGSDYDCYYFAMDVKGSDIELLKYRHDELNGQYSYEFNELINI